MARARGGAGNGVDQSGHWRSVGIVPCSDTYEPACCAARSVFSAGDAASHEQNVTRIASVARSGIELLPQ
jgi:hypothetical protein